ALGLRRNNHHNDGDNARISSPGGATVHSQGREPLGRAEPNIPKAGAPEVRQQPLTPINPPARPSRNRMTARVNDERRNFGASYNFRSIRL
ncbi:MAG: hypothetical protein ACXVCF_19605, partial [Isosphaeraceae bacterium]